MQFCLVSHFDTDKHQLYHVLFCKQRQRAARVLINTKQLYHVLFCKQQQHAARVPCTTKVTSQSLANVLLGHGGFCMHEASYCSKFRLSSLQMLVFNFTHNHIMQQNHLCNLNSLCVKCKSCHKVMQVHQV